MRQWVRRELGRELAAVAWFVAFCPSDTWRGRALIGAFDALDRMVTR
jgi:hypothetical protein